jgi:hypothetical protein
MSDRVELVAQSLNDTLHLLRDVQGHDHLAEPARRLRDVIRSTDVIKVAGVDTPPSNPSILADATSHLYASWGLRQGGDLMPPTAYVFQARPEDAAELPQQVYDERPGIYAVVHRHAGDVVDAGGFQSLLHGDDEYAPLAMLTHCNHPLTRAIVGTHAFGLISQQVHMNVPLSPDLNTRQGQGERGLQHINSALFTSATLAATDESGRTAEWFVEGTASWRHVFQNRPTKPTSPPPAGTELAQAYRAEPLTQPLVEAMLPVVGFYDAVREEGGRLEEAAYGVFKIIEQRALE